MKLNSQTGMNLTELMIAVSIIGLLMVTTIPAFVKRNERQKLDVAADMISNKLLIARQKAVASKKRYRMEYNYGTRAFRILRQESPGTWVSDPPNNLYELPKGIIMSVTSTPADGTVEINPRGTIRDADLPVVLKIKDHNNHLKSIRVSKSGMVQEASTWD